ncbi:unnamed protein product [Dovyalis caffra]|uniref:Uncharacterized protein n=1 Tax=Dovyalis caffra TaxID=77055 RepID=A0AAV1RMK0_9ROSI|nr:unnamed protein product [Dovyalis caffra]
MRISFVEMFSVRLLAKEADVVLQVATACNQLCPDSCSTPSLIVENLEHDEKLEVTDTREKEIHARERTYKGETGKGDKKGKG